MNIEDLQESLTAAGWTYEEIRLKPEELWQVTVSRGARVLMAQARQRVDAWSDVARLLDYPPLAGDNSTATT